MTPIPFHLLLILYAMGVLLIGISIPLSLRRVKPNIFSGVRLPAAMADESVWYDINALGGRHMAIIGAVYLVLLTVALFVVKAWPVDVRVLVPVGFIVVALIVDCIVLWIVSNGMLEKRRASHHSHGGSGRTEG